MLFLALFLTTVAQVVVIVRSPVVNRDAFVFTRIARQLAIAPAAAIQEHDQHPGFPALVLAGRKLALLFTGDAGVKPWVLGGVMASACSGLLAVLALWLLARRLFDARVAGISAILMAVLPLLRDNAADMRSDSPHLSLYLLAAWLLVEGWQRNRLAWFAAAGAASAMAFWVRPEGLSVAIVGGTCLAFVALRRRSMRHAAACALLALTALALCLPYWTTKGRFTSKKDFRLLVTDTVPGPVTPPPAPLKRIEPPPAPIPPPRPSLARLGYAVALLGFRIASELRYWLLVPLGMGLLARSAPRARRDAGKLVAVLLCFHAILLLALYLVADYLGPRHVMVIVALALPWAAAGYVALSEALVRVWRRVSSRPAPRTGVVLALLLAAYVVCYAPRALRPLHPERAHLAPAIQWLDRHARERTILTNSEYICFYADSPCDLAEDDEVLIRHLLSSPGAYGFVILDVSRPPFPPAHRGALHQAGYLPASGHSIPSEKKRHVLILDASSTPPRLTRSAR